MSDEKVHLLLIVLTVIVVFYVLYIYYNKPATQNTSTGEQFSDFDMRELFEGAGVTSAPASQNATGNYNVQQPAQNNYSQQTQPNMFNTPQQQVPSAPADPSQVAVANNYNVQPAEEWGMNEQPRQVKTQSDNQLGQVPNECYPKDVLKSIDLLPKDTNSTWAQVNPMGQGGLGDQNFLNSDYHIGINTVGQTNRNANYQLRSEYPNPQVVVSPWMQTTIEPDLSRRALEIGSPAV